MDRFFQTLFFFSFPFAMYVLEITRRTSFNIQGVLQPSI